MNNNSTKSDFIVALDIGTTKIAMIAARKNEHDILEVIGHAITPSPEGAIRGGQVLNIQQTAHSIQKAKNILLQAFPHIETISEVYVGIAGEHVRCTHAHGEIIRQGNTLETTIQQEEVDVLINNQYKSYVPPTHQIMQVYPISYIVDNHLDIKDPVGMLGSKLGGNFNLISADKTAINQIRLAVATADLKLKKIFLQPIASARAVMCQEDFENLVAVLDIGGGTSDLAIYEEGKLKHTVVIPIGGELITRAIQSGLGLLKTQAEEIKKRYGSAMIIPDPNTKKYVIKIEGYRGLSPKTLSPEAISVVIQKQVEDILACVNSHLQSVGLEGKDLGGGLILTGGGALLNNIKIFTEFKTGAQVRIGLANEHIEQDYAEVLKSPSYSTAIGILLEGLLELEIDNMKKTIETIEQKQESESSHTNLEEIVKKMNAKKKNSFFNPLPKNLKEKIFGLFEDGEDTTFK